MRAEERQAGYGSATVRYNLVIPAGLKRDIEEAAARRDVSGPELARRLLAEGLERLSAQEVWDRLTEVAPLYEARDRALVDKWDRIQLGWEQERAEARRRR